MESLCPDGLLKQVKSRGYGFTGGEAERCECYIPSRRQGRAFGAQPNAGPAGDWFWLPVGQRRACGDKLACKCRTHPPVCFIIGSTQPCFAQNKIQLAPLLTLQVIRNAKAARVTLWNNETYDATLQGLLCCQLLAVWSGGGRFLSLSRVLATNNSCAAQELSLTRTSQS